ncbi:hypothetical protein RJD24_12595 [Bacillaceae bacterium IKA-2]|nr:hypothetical protein RJD24_12595 [Bacillaceae bacterium IKA-2]
MIYKSFSDMSFLIKNNLSLLQSRNFDLIVGMSKTGIVPAYMISLYLNKNCCGLETLLNNNQLRTGITREVKDKLKYPNEAKNILIVLDYLEIGETLEKLLEQNNIKLTNITTLCIYSDPNRLDVDLVLEHIVGPTSFEWNIFSESFTRDACFDIDGVLCIDPNLEQDDDGEKYRDFLLNAPLLIKPIGKINYLVTSRLEKYRSETETWLKKNKIAYNSLIMLDLPSLEERLKLGINAIHKAETYKNSSQKLFYESSRSEAIKIHQLTNKPVYCVDTNEMFSIEMGIPNLCAKVHKISLLEKLKSNVAKLPKPFFNILRGVYRILIVKD